MALHKRKQSAKPEKSEYATHKAELIRLIDKLRKKLTDPNLTEKQYKAIESVLLNKLQALKENRVY